MLAGLYLTLQAQFIAVLQILIYAGAIMVLVVFVIMLLNTGDEGSQREKLTSLRVVAILLATAFVFQIVSVLMVFTSNNTAPATSALAIGTVENLGKELYTNYILPVIAIGVLLTATIVGAVILAKRHLDEPK